MGGKGEAAAAKSVPEPAELFYVDDDSVRKYAHTADWHLCSCGASLSPTAPNLGRTNHSRWACQVCELH